MTRTELVAKANEMSLTFERPVNQIKSSIIEEAIAAAEAALNEEKVPEVEAAALNEEEVPEFVMENEPEAEFVIEENKHRGRPKVTDGSSIREKIIALASVNKTRTEIYNELRVEHKTLNYRYVVQTLLKAKIQVPRQQRDPNSFRSGSAKNDKIAELEAKLEELMAIVNAGG